MPNRPCGPPPSARALQSWARLSVRPGAVMLLRLQTSVVTGGATERYVPLHQLLSVVPRADCWSVGVRQPLHLTWLRWLGSRALTPQVAHRACRASGATSARTVMCALKSFWTLMHRKKNKKIIFRILQNLLNHAESSDMTDFIFIQNTPVCLQPDVSDQHKSSTQW